MWLILIVPKNSLDIPDKYFNKSEVDLDVVAHFDCPSTITQTL